MRALAAWWHIARDAVLRFGRDNLLTHAAAISYAAVLSIFPALLGLIALFGLVLEQQEVERAILQTVTQYLPPQSADLVVANVRSVASARGPLGVVAIGALLWSAAAVGGAIRNALNIVVEAGRPRHWLVRKAVEIGIVLFGGTALLVSVAMTAALGILSGMGDGWIGRLTEVLTQLVRWGLPYLAVGIGFFLLYLLVPTLRLPARSLALGAAVAAVLFETAKAGFFWYLQSLASYQLVYGSVAGVVIFLVWVYLSAAIMLFGAEIAARHADVRGLRWKAKVQD